MKYSIIVLIALTSLFACNKELEEPKDLIPRDEMVLILKDIYLLRQAKNYNVTQDIPEIAEINLAILDKHHVGLKQFQSSYKYYLINDAAYDEILDDVILSLKSELPPEALENEKGDNNLPPSQD